MEESMHIGEQETSLQDQSYHTIRRKIVYLDYKPGEKLGVKQLCDDLDMGRDAVGVRGIRLRQGDYVVGAARAKVNHAVLAITENGYGKQTPVEDYRITNRGGLGIKNYMVTDKTGPVVGIKVVDGTEDLLLVTQAGILIRTPVDSIRTAGRATQGVIVMRFKEEGDHVISLALTDHEEGSAEAEE